MEKTIVNDTENDKIKTMKENLPIFEYRKEIFELLEKNEVKLKNISKNNKLLVLHNYWRYRFRKINSIASIYFRFL